MRTKKHQQPTQQSAGPAQHSTRHSSLNYSSDRPNSHRHPCASVHQQEQQTALDHRCLSPLLLGAVGVLKLSTEWGTYTVLPKRQKHSGAVHAGHIACYLPSYTGIPGYQHMHACTDEIRAHHSTAQHCIHTDDMGEQITCRALGAGSRAPAAGIDRSCACIC